MDQYDVTFSQQIIELLPPDKRAKNIVYYLSDCMISTLQFLRDAALGDYRNGSSAGAWVAGTYARGAKVNYKKAIYVSLIDGNTDTPAGSVNWYFQQQFFIGLTERLAYNGQNLVLTYALNKWFGTTFRQPGTGLSDIYITTSPIDADTFRVGYTSVESSQVGYNTSTETISYSSTYGTQYNCTFYVPESLITSLGSAAMALLNSYINMYIYAGAVYQIIGY